MQEGIFELFLSQDTSEVFLLESYHKGHHIEVEYMDPTFFISPGKKPKLSPASLQVWSI